MPVADCRKEHFNSHCKLEMKMAEFLDYWKKRMQRERERDRGGEREGKGEREREPAGTDSLLYLKDWHLVK